MKYNISQGDIINAVWHLRRGDVFLGPTDTVYALLADATNDEAIRKIFEYKQRPIDKPLIVLVSDMKMAGEIAIFSKYSLNIAKKVWKIGEKPTTLVLSAKNISKLITAGGDTVAVRIPFDKFCLEVIRELGRPLVAPSANASGAPTAETVDMASDLFLSEKINDQRILDVGRLSNKPSRILDITKEPYKIIRE